MICLCPAAIAACCVPPCEPQSAGSGVQLDQFPSVPGADIVTDDHQYRNTSLAKVEPDAGAANTHCLLMQRSQS